MAKDDFWIALGSVILGAVLLKSVFNPNTTINRCPNCSLVVARGMNQCPRCKTYLSW